MKCSHHVWLLKAICYVPSSQEKGAPHPANLRHQKLKHTYTSCSARIPRNGGLAEISLLVSEVNTIVPQAG